ncbi:hypothetical protein MO973_38435 [Paenibacillus sp. TRM 82003]|uniref:hypothetical protein n=1 Tax=Kineococcus sp. TRM81007 TaxID=2925831 RepID=UPI001F55CE3F|nr:hypothetical protein [Kineococcus sp. TRM81007]MCI2239636.1 hypothetical protein [Kineococcus sp. TRM81007]MCI3926082.1 hypothetical protein [Paenibacillus sp. TRM 82003]
MSAEQRRFTTPVHDGALELIDEGDAQLTEEQEAAYEAESDRYAQQGPPSEVRAAIDDRLHRTPRAPAGD